ncbi:hypothetical protein [Effusibacillus lacus]|uniref:hypothetical protein n=1 Tax=Effusibacillus lacus TaxID=1348429 RepID=UPI000BB6FA3A|nr:hypothetical protein [Effusibacillus lacus]TCS68752.1 hypothetical protein EDD64_1402 [Effusibacillus lacus]
MNNSSMKPLNALELTSIFSALIAVMIFVFFFPILYVEIIILYGFIMIPSVAGLVGGLVSYLVKFSKNGGTRVFLVVTLSVSISILMFSLSLESDLVSSYFQKLYKGRLDYNNVADVEFLGKIKPEVGESIRSNLPSDWKLTHVYYDGQSKKYWFEALQPSLLYGSIMHLGVYEEGQTNVKMVSIHQVWAGVIQKMNLGSTESYLSVRESLREKRISFSTADLKTYVVKLEFKNDQIQIVEIIP